MTVAVGGLSYLCISDAREERVMAIRADRWEERASEYISVRNHLVREYGYGLDSKAVNMYEERASYALSRAKGKRP